MAYFNNLRKINNKNFFYSLQGDKLFECLCGLPWNEMNPKTRKDFNIILVQAGMPIQISYKGLLPVNFQSFQFVSNLFK